MFGFGAILALAGRAAHLEAVRRTRLSPKDMMALHCTECGVQYPEDLPLDEEGARTCPNCGAINYLQLKLGAATIVEQDGRILLLRRSDQPFKGFWGLPAGYIRWDEPPEVGAVRETEEECGLIVEIQNLTGAYFFDDDPRGNGVLLAYRCRVSSGTPHATSEATETQFFARGSLPDRLAGSGQDQAILAWQNQRPAPE